VMRPRWTLSSDSRCLGVRPALLLLLQRVAAVTEEHEGRYKVTLGSETETFDVSRHHDIGE